MKGGLKAVMNLAKEANRYFDSREPWRTRKEDPSSCRTTLFVSLQLVEVFGRILQPFLPFTSEKVHKFLAIHPMDWGDSSLVEGGKSLGRSEILFSKIEDEVIQIQIEKLRSPSVAEGFSLRKEEKMDEITIDEFKRLDLRVAEVLKAERAEGSKNLLRLQIRIGEEERQIVAGIAQWYAPEEIVGKRIIVVANLKPATIRGLESKGMLLAAQDGSELSIVVLDKPLKSGVKVS